MSLSISSCMKIGWNCRGSRSLQCSNTTGWCCSRYKAHDWLFWAGYMLCNSHLWRWGRFFSKCLKWSVSSTMSLAHLSQTHLSTRSAPHITKRSPAEPVPSQTTGDSSHRSSQESGMTAPKKTESLYIKHIIRRAVKLYLSNFITQW